ncbi:MAG: S8 family serine peptidase [Oscillospiraceae bacterium]|nr:S8 family serine peptidase [Oscillospiraceae bacterium]
MKRFLFILFLLCAWMLLSSAVLGAQEEAAAFDGYLVRLADERSMVKALPDGCEDLGGGLYYAETSESAAAISASGELLYCKPNYILTIEDCYDDYVPTQWNLLSVGAEAAWAHTDSSGQRDRLGDGVTVAIVDTGVMATHPDLLHADILETVNLSTDADGLDNYHGTFIAGILAAEVNNGIGTDGMVPNVTILPVCITWSGGKTDVKTAIQGIRQAADAGVDVITFSIGGTSDNTALKEACDYAAERGIILVTSAGNYRSGVVKSETTYMYPAAYDCVISVSACRQTSDGVEFDSEYSYFNDGVNVSAPGTNIVSLNLDGSTLTKQGTSFAAPVVTAMAIMARQADPSMDKDAFLRLLEQSSVDLGDPGYDVYYGCGYVNVPAFLEALDAAASESAPMITSQPDGATAEESTAVSFCVAASGEGLTYQWQYSDDGTAWENCSSEGCDTAVLTLTASTRIHNRQFRCIVSDGSKSVVSSSASLTVLGIMSPENQDDPQEQEDGLWVGGIKVTDEYAAGDGWEYDSDRNTLRLNCPNIPSWNEGALILARGMDLTVQLTGNAALGSDGENSTAAIGVLSNKNGEGGNLTITAAPETKLTLKGKNAGIYTDKTLSVSGGEIESTAELAGIFSQGDIIVESGTLFAAGTKNHGICSFEGDIILNGGRLTAAGSISGVTAANGNIIIHDGIENVTASGSSFAVNAPNGIVFIGNALKIRLPIDGTTGDDEHSVYGDHGSSAAAEAEIVPKLIPGDVNGDGSVDATDRMILARYLAGWEGYEEKILSMEAADIDGNGVVEAKDRMILARYLAKWDGYSQYFK